MNIKGNFAATLILLLSSGAIAQAPAAGDGSESAEMEAAGLEDIVVTARRRAESIVSVPVAVTAVTGGQLKTANIQAIASLDRVTPGMRMSPIGSRMGVLSVSIRGMNDTGGLITTDPTVGIYFADAIQARAQGAGRAFYDIASVQVLKGPQGTLFGRNLTGGAILIEPEAPSLDAVTGYVQGIYGNYDRKEVQGAINLPLGPKVALRVAANIARRDGFVTNLNTGSKLRSEYSDSFRGTLLIEPSDEFSNKTIIDSYKSHGRGAGMVPIAVNPAVNTLTGPATNPAALRLAALARRQNRDFYDVEETQDSPSTASNFGVTNTSVANIAGVTVKNIFSYRHVKSDDTAEEGLSQNLLLVQSIGDIEQITEEFQILGKLFDDKLDYITGAYFFRESGRLTQVSSSFGTPRFTVNRAKNESRSLFAQIDYHFTDKLSLTAGGRYTWDERWVRQNVTGPTTPTFNAVEQVSFSKPTWTLSLNYKPGPQSLVYVTTRRGYRSGGFNGGATNAASLTVVRPESLTDVEVGAKTQGRIAGAHYRATIAAYHSDYLNMQRSLVQAVGTPPTATRTLLNAGKARVNGVEADGTIIPIRQLELSGSFAYTDAKYVRYLDPLTGADISNIPFAQTPKWTYRLAAKVNLSGEDSESKLSVAADYYHVSKILSTDVTGILPGYITPGYGLLGGRITYDNIGGKGIRLAAFVANLTNKHYFVATTPFYGAPFGVTSGITGEPRMYGIELGFSF